MADFDYPPTDYDQLEPPPLSEDDFGSDDLFSVFPPDDDFGSYEAVIHETQPPDEWVWSDARLIGVDRGAENPLQRYEIGCLDLYTSLNSGDLAGNYLMLGAFTDQPTAEAFYDQLQRQTDTLPIHELAAFVEKVAQGMTWQPATASEYAAYDRQQHEPDLPPDDPLLQTAAEPGGVDKQVETVFQAFGLEIENADPPPFYDAETGTAYWIGVFQPDKADRSNCLTAILSLGRNPETNEMEALLAPCVPGDWDRAYQAAEYLIQVAEKGGIERCFDAAEGMALATDQRQVWEHPHGLVLDEGTTTELAGYASQAWEVEL